MLFGAQGAGPNGDWLDLLLEPTQVTGATLQGWYRSTENVQMASPLVVTAGGGPIITLTGNLVQTLGIKVQITPDATHYRYSINNGATWLEENIPKASTPHEVDSLGVFLNITAGSYINGTVEEVVQQAWLDKTAHGYNFQNLTVGQRPRIITAGQNSIPALRYNGTNTRLIGPAGLVSGINGVNQPYYAVGAFYLTAVPTGGNVMTLFTIGASAGTDSRCEITVSATNWRARRQADGANTILSSASNALVPQVGFYVFEDEFDGEFRRVSLNSADIIGGTSSVKARQALAQPLTVNQMSLMAQVVPSGTFNLMNGDMYELAVFTGGVPSRQQKLGLVNYLMQRYGLGDRSAANLPMPMVEWDGVHTKSPNPLTWGIKTTLFDPGDLESVKTRFGYRKPVRQDGTPYWFMQGTGDPVTDQLNMDNQNAQLEQTAAYTKKVIRAVDWYPTGDLITSGPVNQVEAIWQAGYDNYETSVLRSQVPFCLILQSFWARYDVNSGTVGTWLNYPAFVAYWVELMKLPNYFRLRGNRPLIYFFNTNASNTWDLSHKNTLVTAILAAGLGQPVIYECTENTALVTALSLHGQTSYGPAGGAPSGASNQHLAYSTQIAADRTNFVRRVSTAFLCPPLTLGNDARPFRGEPPTSWYVDEPPYGELEGHIRDWAAFVRMNYTLCPDQLGLIYAMNETAECGDVLPTTESRSIGPLGTNLGYKLEALLAVKSESFAAVYQNYYNSYTLNADITRTGTWAIIQDLWDNAGEGAAWQYAAARSSTAGSVFSCNPLSNAPGATSPAVKQFEWFGTKAPGYGHVEFRVNGVLIGTVDCSAVSTARHQLLFTSAVLTPGSNNSTATVVGDGNVEIDLVRVTVDRS